MLIKKYNQFLNESVSLPLKKYLSIIKSKLNIHEGNNRFFFDFLNESILPISFYVNITYNKSGNYKAGNVVVINVIKKEFKNLDIDIAYFGKLDLNEICSLIAHELQHVFDLYYDISTKQFMTIPIIQQYRNIPEVSKFIHIFYTATKHEMDARNIMLYDLLRNFKLNDFTNLETVYKNSYIYKALKDLESFKYTDYLPVKNIIKEFLEEVAQKEIKDIDLYLAKLEKHFKNISKTYHEKANDIINEVILDNTPIVEKFWNSTIDIMDYLYFLRNIWKI